MTFDRKNHSIFLYEVTKKNKNKKLTQKSSKKKKKIIGNSRPIHLCVGI